MKKIDLNQTREQYKENEQKRDELYAEHKVLRMGEAKTKKPVVGASVTDESKPAGDMFGEEDPFMKRKREQADAAAAAVTASVAKALGGGAENTLVSEDGKKVA